MSELDKIQKEIKKLNARLRIIKKNQVKCEYAFKNKPFTYRKPSIITPQDLRL